MKDLAEIVGSWLFFTALVFLGVTFLNIALKIIVWAWS